MRYQLTIVDDQGNIVTEIGAFDSEEELEKWARDNRGQLEREQ